MAREAAAAGAVLVRNQGLLPLDPAGLKRVAVVGPGAVRPRSQGGGSATVFPVAVVSPVEGLEAALGAGAEVVHGPGARIRRGLEPVTAGQVTDPETGEPGLAVRFLDADGAVLHAEHRLAGKLIWMGLEVLRRTARIEVAARLRARAGGEHGIGVAGTGRFRLTAGDRVLVDERIRPETDDAAGLLAAPQRGGRLTLAEGDEVELTVVHHLEDGAAASVTLAVEEPSPPEDEELAEAVALAAGADVAVVVVGTTAEIESEGYDRASLALPGRQDELVRAVAAANPRTVVVVNAGSPVELPWRDQVPAILLSWFPGQEFGHALADVLWAGPSRAGGCPPPGRPARPTSRCWTPGRWRAGSSTARASTSATAPGRGPGPSRRSPSATASATPPGPTRAWRRRPPPTPAPRSWPGPGWPTPAPAPAARSSRPTCPARRRRSSGRPSGWPGSRSSTPTPARR